MQRPRLVGRGKGDVDEQDSLRVVTKRALELGAELLEEKTRGPAVSEPLPESEDKGALAAHRALQADIDRRGELHAVARLDEPSRVRTVKWGDGVHDVTDGPYIETKEWLVGFYLVDCATEEEAVARARAICNDRHHVIEVRPVSWRWKP